MNNESLWTMVDNRLNKNNVPMVSFNGNFTINITIIINNNGYSLIAMIVNDGSLSMFNTNHLKMLNNRVNNNNYAYWYF